MKNIESYTRFSEGRAVQMNAKNDLDYKLDKIRGLIFDFAKSQHCDIEEIGSDFELICGKCSIQVMFRPNYIGVKAKGTKFSDNFKYDELNKIKKSILDKISC